MGGGVLDGAVAQHRLHRRQREGAAHQVLLGLLQRRWSGGEAGGAVDVVALGGEAGRQQEVAGIGQLRGDQAGLLPQLPDECVGPLLAVLDEAAGQREQASGRLDVPALPLGGSSGSSGVDATEPR